MRLVLLRVIPFGPSSIRALPPGREEPHAPSTRRAAAHAVIGLLRKLALTRRDVLSMAVLALTGTAVLAIINFAFGSAAESRLTKRLDELSAQVSTLEQAVQANRATLARQMSQETSLIDSVSRIETKQTQADVLLTKLAKDTEALRSAAGPASTSPAKIRRCTSFWCEMRSTLTRLR